MGIYLPLCYYSIQLFVFYCAFTHTYANQNITKNKWQEFTISVRFLDTSMVFHKNTSIQSVVCISLFNHGEDKRL